MTDVFLPDEEERRLLFRDTERMEGTVIDFSDSGRVNHAFAVIEVRLNRTIVVPVEKVAACGESDTG